MDFTRYLVGVAFLLGTMLVLLICAHLIYRRMIDNGDRRDKLQPQSEQIPALETSCSARTSARTGEVDGL